MHLQLDPVPTSMAEWFGALLGYSTLVVVGYTGFLGGCHLTIYVGTLLWGPL